MTHLQKYLSDLHGIRATGAATNEVSFYSALENLFDGIGEKLKPKVRCVIQLTNSGAGRPDGGLFTAEQKKTADEKAPLLGQKPARGAIEVKGTGEDVQKTIQSKQVKDYLAFYGQLLVTNYRSFHLLAHYFPGAQQSLEQFELAADEEAFWKLAAHPNSVTPELAQRFEEYIKRVMLHAAALSNPKDVAFFLASYARDARARVESSANLEALTNIRSALEEALGMKFEEEKGERFFRSTLVQTLFYGVFSAWVLWHKENPQRTDLFDWKAAAWTLHVPMIKALFEQVATPTKLGPLDLVEPLNWTAAALNRVNRAAFFQNFVESHAVQYFYEPFLEAFDPELRKQLGVWYTPPEIVEYMVARVDTVLREELDIPDGLADRRVFVLDPCCGTGAYLVQVLRQIARTLKENKGEDALALAEVKEAAQKRIFGFEIMPAPFVVAHLQLGLLLQTLSVPLDDANKERAGIFLTNALTGWDFIGDNPKLANWPELEAERKGAGKVKQETPILVILGNPPYNAYAGISPEEEHGLVEPYKEGLIEEWGIKKFNLDDLYVRFFRLAERRIAERTGKGVVSFISNHSWVSDPSYVVLRKHLLGSFDRFWIENMHGNRKISEYAPDGRTSETVFAIQGFSPGIQQGVAISLWVKSGKPAKKSVLFRDDINDARAADRRAHLLKSLKAKKFDGQYAKAEPTEHNRFSFRPAIVGDHYREWPAVIDFCAEAPSNGLMEKRGSALIDMDRTVLESRLKMYFDRNVDWPKLKALKSGLTEDAARFDARDAREKVTNAEKYNPDHLLRYALRPYDTRWCYYTSERPLWNEPRPKLWQQRWNGNSFLLTRMNCPRNPEGAPMSFTPLLCDDHYLTPDAVAIPMRLKKAAKQKPKKDDGNGEFGSLLQEATSMYQTDDEKPTANLSAEARVYLSKIGIKNPDQDEATASLLWMHCMAIGFAQAYLTENSDAIRADWPRVPLPASKALLLASAKLGRRVADLLNTERPVVGVDAGKVDRDLVTIAVVTRLSKDPLNLSLTAGWGHRGKEGVIMPGKGKMVSSILDAGPDYKLPWFEFHDVYLNETACWKDIPAPVWEFTIGGYQVVKKWLSYREYELLGRALTADEAREVTHMARRIAALILLQPELDRNYEAVKAEAVPLPKG